MWLEGIVWGRMVRREWRFDFVRRVDLGYENLVEFLFLLGEEGEV